MKTCPCCGSFSADFGIDAKRKDGLNVYCKSCVRAKSKSAYQKDPQKVIARTNAYREANPHVPAKTQAKYNEKRRELWATDPAYVAKQKAERDTDEHRARQRELYQQNKANRREISRKHRAKNADYYRAKAANHAKTNPVSYAVRSSRRRANQKNAVPSWFGEFDEMVVQSAYALARQRTEMTGIQWHVDHVVPLQHKLVCGLHCGANLAVIPASVNQRKYNSYWPDMPEAACL